MRRRLGDVRSARGESRDGPAVRGRAADPEPTLPDVCAAYVPAGLSNDAGADPIYLAFGIDIAGLKIPVVVTFVLALCVTATY